ncbi:carboxypeptidase B-like [Bicyclus anynana]|uniref:Carboxypeptidase B-like n=1 Tax=Bicyclus anynana TaxID=110368 RepID=A0ABM3LZL8_BICAN|nr:carboxypeptidase B-like [Bicyclus anynana]
MRVWLIIASFVVAASARHEEYEGWSSYYVVPYDFGQLEAINEIVQKYNLDVYGHPAIKREGLMLVDPANKKNFTNAMDELNIKYRIHTKDMKAHLELEDKMFKDKVSPLPTRIGGRLPYDQYQSVQAIHQYMDDIAAAHPNIARVVTPTVSFNGQPMKYMRISTTNFQDTRKPIIFLDGGMHGREWLSIPPVTYAINQLVENVTDPELLNRFDWILLPIVNPDGYRFSRDSSVTFRKTRSIIPGNQWSMMCPGVDLDRNFDFVWNTIGTSDHHCSYVFPGVAPFSEVEARVVRDILHQHRNILMYITFSSFGSFIMYPWAFDGSLSDHAFRQHSVGISMADAINRVKHPSFLPYRVGNAGLIRGSGMAGTSIDYAHSVGVPLAYTIDLPGVFGGYWMDPIWIEQVVIETWEGVRAGVRRALATN